MRWPLRNFYTFNHLVDSYRNTISEWAVGFREASFSSVGLIFGGEEISITDTWPTRESYIFGPPTQYPPYLVHVVIECPPMQFQSF